MSSLQKKLDEEDAKFRAEQEARNHKQMEELAKIQPTPTVAELNELMSMHGTTKKPVEDKLESKSTKTVEKEKASEPEHPQHEGGAYKTRASMAGKKE